MDLNGHVPLPPYINRPDEIDDIERYQTVFAKNKGLLQHQLQDFIFQS